LDVIPKVRINRNKSLIADFKNMGPEEKYDRSAIRKALEEAVNELDEECWKHFKGKILFYGSCVAKSVPSGYNLGDILVEQIAWYAKNVISTRSNWHEK
jgi:hypothetical protein